MDATTVENWGAQKAAGTGDCSAVQKVSRSAAQTAQHLAASTVGCSAVLMARRWADGWVSPMAAPRD
jgi:hypothetical protein